MLKSCWLLDDTTAIDSSPEHFQVEQGSVIVVEKGEDDVLSLLR
jgi:hypothetical protein